MEAEKTVTVDRHEVGDEVVETTAVGTASQATQKHSANKAIQVVQYLATVVGLLILLRAVLLLLGARNTGIVQFIYQATEPFVAPYYGILGRSASYGGAQLEVASLLALGGLAVITFIIIGFIRLLK